MTPPTLRRRKSGQGLRYGTWARFAEAKNATRRDLLADLMHEHVRCCGRDGLDDILRLARAVEDTFQGTMSTNAKE